MWFSTMLRLAVLVQPGGQTRAVRSVVVFRAPDWDRAKTAAVEIGRTMEQDYTNSAGERVRWRLEKVETLDQLGESIENGREVYSESIAVAEDELVPFSTEFDVSNVLPDQSGV